MLSAKPTRCTYVCIPASNNTLVIHHTVQPKNSSDALNYEEALDDLLSKYKLLSSKEIIMYETPHNATFLFHYSKKMRYGMKWKWSKPRKVQVYGFVLSMPFIDVALQLVLYDKQQLTDWRYVGTFFSTYLYHRDRLVVHACTIRPFNQSAISVVKRNSKTYFLQGIYQCAGDDAFGIAYISCLSLVFIFLAIICELEDFKWGYLIGLCVNIVFDTLWEVLYVLERYKESLTEKELAEQTHTAHEFELLKSQVNPAFFIQLLQHVIVAYTGRQSGSRTFFR